MTAKELGQLPAFPVSDGQATYSGMTLRQHISIELTKALLIAEYRVGDRARLRELICEGVNSADDMLEALEMGDYEPQK